MDVEAADPGDGAETGNPGAVLMLTAALSPAVENSEPAEDEVLESEPLFTTQAYTDPVMLASDDAPEEKDCVLQQKIDDAMASDTGDTFNVTAEDGAKSVSINAGNGANTLNATVSGGDFSFVSGDTSDAVNLDLEGSALGTVYVDAGGNTDDMSITVNGQAKDPVTWDEVKDEQGNVIFRTLVGGMCIQSGAGDDNVDVRANAGDISVDTGLGSDAVYVFKGDHRTPESIDYTRIYNPTEEINENATSVVTLINISGARWRMPTCPSSAMPPGSR